MKNKRKSGITSLSSVKIHWNQHLPCGNIHITCTIWVMINVGRGCFTYLKFEPLWNHGWNHGKWKIMKAVPSLILLLISSYVPPEFRLWKSWTKFLEGSLTTKKKNNAKKNNLHANPEDPWWSMHGIFTYGSQKNSSKCRQIHANTPYITDPLGNDLKHLNKKKSWNRSESRSWNALVLAEFISHTIQASPIVVQDGQPQQKNLLKKQRWGCFFSYQTHPAKWFSKFQICEIS